MIPIFENHSGGRIVRAGGRRRPPQREANAQWACLREAVVDSRLSGTTLMIASGDGAKPRTNSPDIRGAGPVQRAGSACVRLKTFAWAS